MARRIEILLAEYGENHQNPTNKIIHWVCVPLIFFSIVGLLASIPADSVQFILGEGNPYANWASVLLILTIIYYASMSIPLSIGMMLFAWFCLFMAKTIMELAFAPLWAISLGIFLAAWIGQFFGHRIEGKKPSFFKDLQFLLIGPAWLMHFFYERIGIPY